MSFTGRVSDAGGPITGTVTLVFQIYDAPSGGAVVWEETHAGVGADAGLVFVELGTDVGNGLDDTVFDGSDRFLQVTVDGDVMSPRVPLLTVPYATRAGSSDRANSAELLGSLTPADVALSTHNHDGDYTAPGHDHSAANITSGTLSPDRYSAYTDLAAESYLDNSGAADLMTKSQLDARFALTAHSHDAGDITTGTLPNARYSAYSDLGSEGYLDNNAGGDLLTRTQSDSRYSLSTHNHTGVYAPNSHSHSGLVQSGRATLTGASGARTAASFTVANTGTCIAWVHSYSYASGNVAGYYYVRPYSVINGAADSFGVAATSAQAHNYANYHFADDIGSWSVTAGQTAAFGCSMVTSGDWTPVEVTCNVAWMCN